jgi:NADP-dependent 3-hydroxy acid dehydrogenase YdfG
VAIALADMDINGIQETISLIKSYGFALQLLALQVDVTQMASVKNMVSETIKAFSRIDYGMFLSTTFPHVRKQK